MANENTTTPLVCCWCDDVATESIHYADDDHPACRKHGQEWGALQVQEARL